MPSSSLTTGGLKRKKRRWPRGRAALGRRSSTSSGRTPNMRAACSRGLPMVAVAADDAGARAVEPRDAHQAPQHVGHVRAEDALVRVQLVDHHVPQVLQRARPAGVVGQDPGVQHVGVGQDDAGALAGGTARVARGVAVVDDRAGAQPRGAHQLAQPRLLIAGERLGGKKVDRARVGIVDACLQDGQVEAEALAAGGGRGDDHVPRARLSDGGLHRARLVRVQLLDPLGLERLAEARSEEGREGGQRAAGPREGLVGAEARLHPGAVEPPVQDGLDPLLGLPGRRRHVPIPRQTYRVCASPGRR